MDTGGACLEPKWTSLRAMRGDSLEVLRDKYARLSLIAKAYRLRLVQSNGYLPAAIPLPVPLDSEGVARLNVQASDSSAQHPPPQPESNGRDSALARGVTCSIGLGRTFSPNPKPSASQAANQANPNDLAKQQQPNHVYGEELQNLNFHPEALRLASCSNSEAGPHHSHGSRVAEASRPGSGSFSEECNPGCQDMPFARPGRPVLLHGLVERREERSCVHADGGAEIASAADSFMARPMAASPSLMQQQSLQQQPAANAEHRIGNDSKGPEGSHTDEGAQWKAKPFRYVGLTSWQSTGLPQQSEGDEWSGLQGLAAASGPVAKGALEHESPAVMTLGPVHEVSITQQEVGDAATVAGRTVSYTANPALQSAIEPIGASEPVAFGNGDTVSIKSGAAVAELEAEAGQAGGQENDDDVVYMGSTPGDPAAYGDWLQAQGTSQIYRATTTRRGLSQYPPSSRPDLSSKQQSILQFIQSRNAQHSSCSGRGATTASGSRILSGGARRGGNSLWHGRRFPHVQQPLVSAAQLPDQEMAAALATSPEAQMRRPKADDANPSAPYLLSHDRSEAALSHLQSDDVLRLAFNQAVTGAAAAPSPSPVAVDCRIPVVAVSAGRSPFHTIQVQPQSSSQALAPPTYESDPNHVRSNAAPTGAPGGPALLRRSSGSLFAFGRSGSGGVAAIAAAIVTDASTTNRLPCVSIGAAMGTLNIVEQRPPLFAGHVAMESQEDPGPGSVSRSSDEGEDSDALPVCRTPRGPSRHLRGGRMGAHFIGEGVRAATCSYTDAAPGEDPLHRKGIERSVEEKLHGASREAASDVKTEAGVLMGPGEVLVWQAGSEAAAVGSLSMRALADLNPGVAVAATRPCIGAFQGPQVSEEREQYCHQQQRMKPLYNQPLQFDTPQYTRIQHAQLGQQDGMAFRVEQNLDVGSGDVDDGTFVPASGDEVAGTAADVYVVPATPLSGVGSDAVPTLSAPDSVAAACRGTMRRSNLAGCGAHAGRKDKGPSAMPWGQSPLEDWITLQQQTRAVHSSAAIAATPLPADRTNSHPAEAVEAVIETPAGLASTERDALASAEWEHGITTLVTSLFGPTEAGGEGAAAAVDSVTAQGNIGAAAEPSERVASPHVAYYGRYKSTSGNGGHDELLHPGRVLLVQVALDICSGAQVHDAVQPDVSTDGGCSALGDAAAAHDRDLGCYVACVVETTTECAADVLPAGALGSLQEAPKHKTQDVDSASGPMPCALPAPGAGNKHRSWQNGGKRQIFMLYIWRLMPNCPPVRHSKLVLMCTPVTEPAGPAAAPFDSGTAGDAGKQLEHAIRLLSTPGGGLCLVVSSAVDVPNSYEDGSAIPDVLPGVEDLSRDLPRYRKHYSEGRREDVLAGPGQSVLHKVSQNQLNDCGSFGVASTDGIGHVKVFRFQEGVWRLTRVLRSMADSADGGGATSTTAPAAMRCLACTARVVLPPLPERGDAGRATEASPVHVAATSSPGDQRPNCCWQIVAGGDRACGCIWRLDPCLEAVLHWELLPPALCRAESPGMASELIELVTLPDRPHLVVGTVADGSLAVWDVGIARAAAVANGAVAATSSQGLSKGQRTMVKTLQLAPATPATLLSVHRPEGYMLRCLQPVAISVPGLFLQQTSRSGCVEMVDSEFFGGHMDNRGEGNSLVIVDTQVDPGNLAGSKDCRTCGFAPVSFLSRACAVAAFAGAAEGGAGEVPSTATFVTPVRLRKDAVEMGRTFGLPDVTCLSTWAGIGVIGTQGGKVLVWDCKQGALVAGWQMPAPISAVAVSSRMIFAAAEGRVLFGIIA